MSFLSLAFLFALPLAAAPLLLHLFDRRRNTVIQWGAMQFLTEASAKKTSARRLKQWLLLAMRVLAIAMLIFALARPLVPAGYLGSTARTETVFVVDNSMSMGRKIDGQSYLQRVIDQLSDEISKLPGRDRVRLMTTAPYPTWLTVGGAQGDDTNRIRILEQLSSAASSTDVVDLAKDPSSAGSLARPTTKNATPRSLQAVETTSDLLSALHAAAQEPADPTVAKRRIIVFSDGQANDWRTEDEAEWKRLHDSLAKTPLPIEVDLQILDRSPASPGPKNVAPMNLAIDRLAIRRSIVGVGQPVALSATIRNHSADSVNDAAITWSIAGEEQQSDLIDIVEDQQSIESTWTHAFQQPGKFRVSCQIDHEDDLMADNRSSVVVEVVDRVPVVVVEEAFELAELQQDSYFVQAALGWIQGETLGANSVYVPTVVSMAELATVDLRKQRVVVIPSVVHMDEDLVDRLADFVRDGGGLWVGLGPRTDAQWFNQNLFADASGLSPVGLNRIADSGNDRDAEIDEETSNDRLVHIDPFRNSHIATYQLADENQLDLAETIVDRWFEVAGTENRDDLSILLSLSNGSPLAIENRFGRGRVIVQTVPLKLQWSDLARKQSFVVMVRDWIDYLAQPRSTKFNLQPGEPIVVAIDEQSSQSEADDAALGPPTGILTGPQGDTLELAAIQGDQGFEFRTSRTRVPGDYDLEIGLSESSIPFRVQRSSSESDLAVLGSEAETRLRGFTRPERDAASIENARSDQSDPIWPFLLLGLIGLLTGELVLSGILAKERFGVAGIAKHAEIESSLAVPTSFSDTKLSDTLRAGDSRFETLNMTAGSKEN